MFVFEDIFLDETFELSDKEELECKRLIEDGIRRGLSLKMIAGETGIPLPLVEDLDESLQVEIPIELD